jgi:hypothetical protein
MIWPDGETGIHDRLKIDCLNNGVRVRLPLGLQKMAP